MKSELELQILSFIFLCAFVLIQGNIQNSQWDLNNGELRMSGKRESLSTTFGGRRRGTRHRGGSNFNALLEVARDGRITENEMQRFTSGTPAPGETNCHVEVEESVYRSYPGRCVRLGSTGIHACQASGYMDVNNVQCVARETTLAPSTETTPSQNPPEA